MKSFIFFLLLTAVGMTQGAQWLTRYQIAQRVWRLQFAVQQATEAKAAFQRQNADNQNALDSFDQDTAEGREQTLIDAGLLSDQTAMCLVDPCPLDERPTARTPAQLDAAAHAERLASGNGMSLAMR